MVLEEAVRQIAQSLCRIDNYASVHDYTRFPRRRVLLSSSRVKFTVARTDLFFAAPMESAGVKGQARALACPEIILTRMNGGSYRFSVDDVGRMLLQVEFPSVLAVLSRNNSYERFACGYLNFYSDSNVFE